MADNIKDLTLETATDEVKTDEIETVSKETVEVEETAKTGLLGATANSTGDVPATSFTTKTAPDGTDNLILFNQNTNVGYQIDYDNLADAILNKITSKTFSNQIGGSSAATLLAQLSTLNSKISYSHIQVTTEYKNAPIDFFKFGRIVVVTSIADMKPLAQGFTTLCEVPEGYRPSMNITYGFNGNFSNSSTNYRYYRIENYKDLIVYTSMATDTTNGGFGFVYMV